MENTTHNINWLIRIGLIVKKIRKERGITQEELEELSGVTTRQISDIENGLANIKFTTLIKLASGLGLEVTDLLSYELTEEDYC